MAMNALMGAIVGLLGAVGIWVAVAGATGVRVRERPALVVDWTRVGLRVGIVAVAWVVSWAVTGWPMAGVIGAAVAMTVPMLIAARRARAAALAKTAALASWAEMLRDTMSGHAGLNQAIAVTANVAPEPIRQHVRALAVRAERQSLSAALRTFAAEVENPVADLIVAALVIADERQARDLTKLLSEIASSARQQAAMRMRVETGRARTYAQSQVLVAITLLLVIVLLVFSPEFLAPYDSFGGQIVLAVIGALFGGALLGLVQLGRPVEVPRLLAGIEEGTSR
jgi:Flp pilus assembly protein TadB